MIVAVGGWAVLLCSHRPPEPAEVIIRQVVIVDSVRTGLAKSFRGKFNQTRPDDMAAHCVNALLERNDLDPLLVDDCIARGLDYHDGGARYNTTYIQGVGIGTITDSLSAIKRHVFDGKQIGMDELLAALDVDFAGCERLQARLRDETPRYGNDDDDADAIMKSVFRAFFEEVDGRPNTKGGRYCIDMLPTTCHVYFGSVTQATPDGRLAGEPVSEGISPVQGADRRGPTAVLCSAAKMDHALTGGTLLNMKFTPRLLEGEEGIANLAHLVRTYFKLGGHHVQFNVVSAKTLLDAQAHPESHRDLIVRVAGYSAFFVELCKDVQDEIISRTMLHSI